MTYSRRQVIVATAGLAAFAATSANAENANAQRWISDMDMDIKRNGSRPSAKGSPDWFTGSVRLDPLFQAPDPARVGGGQVTFDPGARTAWHTHPLGQTLIITACLGWVQRDGGPVEEVRPGNLVADRPRLAAMLRPMLAARSALSQQYAVLHKMLLEVVRVEPTCRRLMTIPGVGALTAVTYLTTIDDPARFQRSRDVGAHLGLTPRKYASGEIDRNGSISKCGDTLLRTTLYQAALALLTRTQRWSTLKAWGMAVAKRRGLRRAVVAVARKLAIVMHRGVWTDGSEFRWSREEAMA
jgi:hypothetical protein